MNQDLKGMYTCRVCNRKFPLLEEERYTTKDAEKSGLLASINGNLGIRFYDTFDCPMCGCQNVIQERKQYISIEDIGIPIEENANDEEDDFIDEEEFDG